MVVPNQSFSAMLDHVDSGTLGHIGLQYLHLHGKEHKDNSDSL